jgi:hypothetical protein
MTQTQTNTQNPVALQLVTKIMTDLQENKDLAQKLKDLTPEQQTQELIEHMFISAEGLIDAGLPDTWTDYLDWLQDENLLEQCQATLEKHNHNSPKAWHALPQKARDTIAAIQTMRLFASISETSSDQEV